MSSAGSKSFGRIEWTASLLLAAAIGFTGCGFGIFLSPKIIEGKEFAHEIRFPAPFQRPTVGGSPLVFINYGFRIAKSSPDLLLVAACADTPLSPHALDTRVCSPNAFAIDTKNGYSVRNATTEEWAAANPAGEKEMDDPTRRESPADKKKPPYLQTLRLTGASPTDDEGFRYRGKEYHRRGDWIASLTYGDSEDGKLVFLTGVDRRSLPKTGFMGDPINAGLYGLVTVDIFDTSGPRRLAALDIDCHKNVNGARKSMSLVNSRWVAFALDLYLRRMLLLDFSQAEKQTK